VREQTGPLRRFQRCLLGDGVPLAWLVVLVGDVFFAEASEVVDAVRT
jgi:hypothetical protein